jgi:hypothetical protein
VRPDLSAPMYLPVARGKYEMSRGIEGRQETTRKMQLLTAA